MTSETPNSNETKHECFIIMPISDSDSHQPGHFQHVFTDIFGPACEKAGFLPIRADQVKQTNLIHLDVLQKLLKSPMALCDLSTRNPNVLFELGLRQAFDQPVVLVREVGTPDIFDIAPLRYTEYRKERIYHEALQDQNAIAEAISATEEAFQNGLGINSIVKLLSLSKPATLVELEGSSNDPLLQIIRAELSELRSEFRSVLQEEKDFRFGGPARPKNLPTIVSQFQYTINEVRSYLNDIEFEIANARATHQPSEAIAELMDEVDSLLARVAIFPRRFSHMVDMSVYLDLKREVKHAKMAYELALTEIREKNKGKAEGES